MDEIEETAQKLVEQVGDGSMGLPAFLREAVIAMPPEAEQERERVE